MVWINDERMFISLIYSLYIEISAPYPPRNLFPSLPLIIPPWHSGITGLGTFFPTEARSQVATGSQTAPTPVVGGST